MRNTDRAAPGGARRRGDRRWEHSLLRLMEYVAYPAFAGAAWSLLSLGVVTWLPALAAMAHALQGWRLRDDARCFVGVFAAWRLYRRQLLSHSAVSTALAAILVANLVFLAGRPGLLPFALLSLNIGLAAAFALYHLGLAAAAGVTPDADLAQWRRNGMILAFGSPGRTIKLLAATLLAPTASILLPFGPALFGASLPVLLALSTATPAQAPPDPGDAT